MTPLLFDESGFLSTLEKHWKNNISFNPTCALYSQLHDWVYNNLFELDWPSQSSITCTRVQCISSFFPPFWPWLSTCVAQPAMAPARETSDQVLPLLHMGSTRVLVYRANFQASDTERVFVVWCGGCRSKKWSIGSKFAGRKIAKNSRFLQTCSLKVVRQGRFPLVGQSHSSRKHQFHISTLSTHQYYH